MDNKEQAKLAQLESPVIEGGQGEHKTPLTCSEYLKTKIYDFIESSYVIIFMLVVTIWVLFGDDIRQLTVDSRYDDPFYIITLVCFGLFVVEIILTLYAKPDYRWGFFFYLDILSTLTLLLDVQWISDGLFGDNGGSNPKSAASFAKTARASRIGTRASRIVRIIRLIRLIRVVKLYKASKQAQVKKTDRSRSKLKKSFNMQNSKHKKPAPFSTIKPIDVGNQDDFMNDDFRQEIDDVAFDADERFNGMSLRRVGDMNEMSKIESIDEDKDKSLSKSKREIEVVKKTEENEDVVAEEEIFQETNVGKQLSDLTTKRVIILILSIMISIPIFSIDTYWPDTSSYLSGVRNLLYVLNRDQNYANNQIFLKAWKAYIVAYSDEGNQNVLRKLNLIRKDSSQPDSTDDLTDEIIQLTDTAQYLDLQEVKIGRLRLYERKTILEPDDVDNLDEGQYSIIALYDQKKDFDLNSYLGIGRTVFVCLILSASAVFFSREADTLVLQPIENMLKKVRLISKNPLSASRVEDEQQVFWDDFLKSQKKKREVGSDRRDQDNYETTILEKTITKIGSLLCIGFGDSGANLVAQNMAIEGNMDPFINGKRVVCIFCYCQIRQFTMLTEVLQENTCIFINEVAEIVHNVAEMYSGVPNKNIGDSFIMVWRLDSSDVEKDGMAKCLVAKKDSVRVKSMAELSVMSVVKTQIGVAKSGKLKKYRSHKEILERLGELDYKIGMSFGLHIGWAVEGGIGSVYKLDASYLSPNVKLPGRLAAVTSHYGVSLLLSDKVRELIRDPLKSMLRQIDCLKLKNWESPIGIFTIDADIGEYFYLMADSEDDKVKTGTEKKRERIELRKSRDLLKEKLFSGEWDVKTLIMQEDDMMMIRKRYPNDFFREWNAGVNAYLRGEWTSAQKRLSKTLRMLSTSGTEWIDHPSQTLLNFMQKYDFVAPESWRGFRDISEL